MCRSKKGRLKPGRFVTFSGLVPSLVPDTSTVFWFFF